MHRLLGFLTILATLAALALAPAAGAATFDLGPGVNPDVAVDESGTGHFVWDDPGGGVTYCQVPRGARACSLTRSFAPEREAVGRSTYVFLPAPGRVVVFSGRCCTGSGTVNVVIESNDGGQTFAAPRQIGTVDPKSNAALGAGERILGGGGTTWQVQPVAGPPPSSGAELTAGFSVPTTSSGAFFGGTRPVVVVADGDNASFSYWTGAGDVNDASTWSGPNALDTPGTDVTLAGGPAGLVAIYRVRGDGGSSLVARKFDGATFGPPVTVSEVGDPIEPDVHANPVTGEFTALWVDNREPNDWRIARSKDGVSWSAPAPIVRGNADADNRFNLQVAAAADGRGFAVSDGQTGGAITAAPLEEIADGDGGGDGPAPIATTTVNGTELSFFGPAGCVQRPRNIVLRVTSRRKRQLSPRRRVKITRVVFSVDRRKKTDRRKAFRKSFSTRRFKLGSRHRVGAVVRLAPVKRGAFRPKVKRLKGRFRMCRT